MNIVYKLCVVEKFDGLAFKREKKTSRNSYLNLFFYSFFYKGDWKPDIQTIKHLSP